MRKKEFKDELFKPKRPKSWSEIKGINLIFMFGGLFNGSKILLDDIEQTISITHPQVGTGIFSYNKLDWILVNRLQLLRVFKFDKEFMKLINRI